MVKIYNISITPPRRCSKGRLCSYNNYYYTYCATSFNLNVRLVPNCHDKSIQEVSHQPNQ